jgi:hypothetical protein
MGKTALFSNHQPGGMFAIEDESRGTGSRFFVQATTGTDRADYGRNPDAPVASLDYAIGLCTASKGDIIYLMEGHAETTTAIALDVAGVSIIGLGVGRNRPTLTSTAAATDLINVTAANCRIRNVRLVGAASACTSLLDGSSVATDFELLGCELALAATPLNAITWSGQRPIIRDLTVTQSANGADYIVAFEAGVDQFIFSNWTVLCPNGLDNGLIDSGAFAHEGYLIENINAVGLDTLVLNFVSSTAGGPDGLFKSGAVMYSAAITSVEDGVAAATSKGVAYGLVYATDVTGKFSAKIPLSSAS